MRPLTFYQKYKHILAYLLFGALTTLINQAVYFLCYDLWHWPNLLSTILAWILSVAFAFFTNKSRVFQSHDWSARTLLREAGSFLGYRLLTGLLDLLLMLLLVDLWQLPGSPMKLAANILVIILNYIFSKWFIFNKKTE